MKSLYIIPTLAAALACTPLTAQSLLPSSEADNGANPSLETIRGKNLPICITDSKTPETDWNARVYLYSIRCPLPYSDWTDRNGWMVILLNKNKIPALCLETPAGRVNDILIDEKRQLAVVSLQVDKATPVIYIVSLKKRQAWAADTTPLINAYDTRRPAAEKDPQDLYALSSFQLVGLRQTGGTIEGLVRHRSALNPQETGLSMLIRFSINLDAPKPAPGQPWPLTVTQVEDTGKELEWNPGNRDFNPPLAKPE